MKDKWLLRVCLSIYILGAAALVVELFRLTPASADAVSTTREHVQQTEKGFEHYGEQEHRKI